WFRDELLLLDRWKRRADWLRKRLNVTIRPIDLKRYDAEVEQLHRVYDQAFRENWGMVQLTEAEFRHMGAQMRQIGDPGNVPIAEVDGKIVGFAVTLPDLNEAIAPLGGRLTTCGLPIGAIRLLWRLRHVKTGRMLVLVILEEYRGRGIEQLLIHETCRYGKEILHYTGAELSWTLEDNHVINRTIETVGGHHYKTYRVYHATLPTPSPA
ncbi:MAG: GNAT family N-acetyltransferase, partial [Planctomycetia bacterium]|nr:GNAT family N-acetyltransferase [Planctomycetia bacterium]